MALTVSATRVGFMAAAIFLGAVSAGAAESPGARIGQEKSSVLPRVASFFQKMHLTDAALSPDGTRVALRVGDGESRYTLAVVDLDTMAATPVAGYSSADIGSFRWVNDKRLVFGLTHSYRAHGNTADRYPSPEMTAINVDGSGRRTVMNRWDTQLMGPQGRQDGLHFYVVRYEADDYQRLIKVNSQSGSEEEIDSPPYSQNWLFDGLGQLRFAYTAKAKDRMGALHMRDSNTGKWRKLREFDRFTGDGRLTPVYVSPRGQVYVKSPLAQDKDALFTYDPERDVLSAKPVLALDGFDLDPFFLENDDKLLGIRFMADALVTQWLDADMQAQQDAVDKLLPSTINALTPPRRGGQPYLLVYAFSDVNPGSYYAYNRKTGKLTLLGGHYPNVKSEQMATMDMVRFPARDGLEIPAYLTLPAGEKKTQLPLIVLVHGGPWVRGAQWGWDPEVQFLASRGYAVIQPEFRGSTGFGNKHFRAGFKQWGLAMQNDLADTARWAVAQGIADPKRICIMGASYGGYAAMMGLVNDPDLFRCAVNWVGVTEVDLFYNWGDLAENPAFKAHGISALIGDREKDAEQLRSTSPLQQAARIRNPVLMAYGGADRRVPLEHGKRMLSALKGHNSQVEWIEYEKEGHGWATIETQRDFWSRVDAFLAKNLKAP